MVKKGDQWQLVEMSEPVDGLEDQEEEIEELRGEYMAKIITFVAHSTTSQAPEDLGFEVEGFDYEASRRRRTDEDDYAIPIADDEGEFEAIEGREIEGPVGPGGVDLGTNRRGSKLEWPSQTESKSMGWSFLWTALCAHFELHVLSIKWGSQEASASVLAVWLNIRPVWNSYKLGTSLVAPKNYKVESHESKHLQRSQARKKRESMLSPTSRTHLGVQPALSIEDDQIPTGALGKLGSQDP